MTLRPSCYLVIAAIVLFLVLAGDAAFADTAPGDVWLTQQFQSLDSGALQDVLDGTEDFAGMPLLAIATVAAAGLFIWLGGAPPAAAILAALPTRLFVTALKELFERPRPSPGEVDVGHQPDSFSFPSGHAFNAVVVYGLIIAFAAVYIPYRPARLALQAACAWVIIGASAERVYDGNHWPSDVAAGLALGGIVLAGLLLLHEQLRQRGLHSTATRS